MSRSRTAICMNVLVGTASWLPEENTAAGVERASRPKRVAIFIDGSNLFLSSRDGNVNVAPEDLKRKLVRGRGLGALEYFGSSRDPPSETEERWIGGFRDAGFHVHIFPLQSR